MKHNILVKTSKTFANLKAAQIRKDFTHNNEDFSIFNQFFLRTKRFDVKSSMTLIS
jgi:hypothetical protein